MKQEITELARAVDRLAAAVESLKEAEKENPPCTPLKEKGKKNNNNDDTPARERFVKPTVEEVAAHVRAKGYTFDAEQFWHYYDSNGWKVGSHAMKSWQSACVTWQKKEEREAAVEAARQAHIDAKMDERAEKRLLAVRPLTAYERKRAEFELQAEADAARKERSREATIAALTATDWELCRESGCRHCAASGGCRAGVALPPDHRLNARPCRPEECPSFGKEGGAA